MENDDVFQEMAEKWPSAVVARPELPGIHRGRDERKIPSKPSTVKGLVLSVSRSEGKLPIPLAATWHGCGRGRANDRG